MSDNRFFATKKDGRRVELSDRGQAAIGEAADAYARVEKITMTSGEMSPRRILDVNEVSEKQTTIAL